MGEGEKGTSIKYMKQTVIFIRRLKWSSAGSSTVLVWAPHYSLNMYRLIITLLIVYIASAFSMSYKTMSSK